MALRLVLILIHSERSLVKALQGGPFMSAFIKLANGLLGKNFREVPGLQMASSLVL
ncbi:hypothetical protein KC19_VG256700 [Ceratodon purpureus]|uniref:Uncharacterized protein n=1 Tax=Ceratodon purpureus TaxID=3225 RepID=A0A8T0HU87_CERPU|nr:hypothetical protein KC19_VG256700 [Ceratodon purpureus]